MTKDEERKKREEAMKAKRRRDIKIGKEKIENGM